MPTAPAVIDTAPYLPVLCDPCLGERQPDGLPNHDHCQSVPWCECLTELLIEAEETE